MSRGGGGFPVIIAVLGVLILIVVGIFIYLQLKPDTPTTIDVPTMAPTQVPTEIPTTPEPTPEPTPEVVTVPPVEESPTVDPNAATATAYVTAPPPTTGSTVWINVDALMIHSQANFTSTTVGKIPYSTMITGDVSGKWMYVSFEGAQGYIYLGKTSDGRALVVYSESALEVLVETEADEVDMVDNVVGNEVGSNLTVTITFTSAAYADDNVTGALQISDFSTSSNCGVLGVSHVAGSQTAILTLWIDTGSGSNYVLTIKPQSVFNGAGQACTEQSFNFS